MEFQVILPSGEGIDITLTSTELSGIALSDKIEHTLNISDKSFLDYFGISYVDKADGGRNWISPADDIKKTRAVQCKGVTHLQIAVRVFPKDPHLTFPSLELRRMFRQYMKSLLVNDILPCDVDTSVKLDGFIAQAELGDHDIANKQYFQRLNELEIYVPSGSALSEKQYLNKVQAHHVALKDMSPVKADIFFLSTMGDIPTYGYVFYSISDKARKKHVLALSADGIHFIYETTIEKAAESNNKETFSWDALSQCETNLKNVKMRFFMEHGVLIDRKFKIQSKNCDRDGVRLKCEVEKYKKVYSRDSTDDPCIKTIASSHKIPQRRKSVGLKLSSWKRSIKRVHTTK